MIIRTYHKNKFSDEVEQNTSICMFWSMQIIYIRGSDKSRYFAMTEFNRFNPLRFQIKAILRWPGGRYLVRLLVQCLYDPIGLAAAFTIRAKIGIQPAVRSRLGRGVTARKSRVFPGDNGTQPRVLSKKPVDNLNTWASSKRHERTVRS